MCVLITARLQVKARVLLVSNLADRLHLMMPRVGIHASTNGVKAAHALAIRTV